MLSTSCGGLQGAGDVELLPLTAAAAVGVTLEKRERSRSLAGPGRAGSNAQVPREGNTPSSPRPWVPTQLTSAAASAPPACPGCLNLAGSGKILWWLWAWALKAATNNSLSTAPAPKASLNAPNLAKSLSWSAGTNWLGEAQHPDTSSEGCMVTIRRSKMSQSIARGRHNGLPSPMKLGLAALQLQHMHVAFPQRPLRPPSLRWCSASVFHASHQGLGCVFTGPHQVVLPWQKSPGTYGKRVCWVTLCASLGGYRTESHRLSPRSSTAAQPSGLLCFLPRWVTGSTCLAVTAFSCLSPPARGHKGDPSLLSSPQASSRHYIPLGVLERREVDEAEGLRGAQGTQGGSVGLVRHGAEKALGHPPQGTAWCPWKRHQGDGDRLFPALPGERVREGANSGNRTENQNQNPCEDD